MRVGLAWASGSGHYEAEDRSVTLADMAPLAEVADIQFLSMQFGRPSMQRTTPPAGMQIEEAGQGDFAETASVIAALDLFVTVDTAIANLAGALHAPTWVAVPFVADWRWGAEGEHTPWYPSARVYRQPSPNDWKSVFRRMASDLSQISGSVLHRPA
jgi:hypothetical protein